MTPPPNGVFFLKNSILVIIKGISLNMSTYYCYNMVELYAKMTTTGGTSRGFRVPKTLIECKVLDPNKTYRVIIEEIQEKPYKGKAKTSEDASVAKRCFARLLNSNPLVVPNGNPGGFEYMFITNKLISTCRGFSCGVTT